MKRDDEHGDSYHANWVRRHRLGAGAGRRGRSLLLSPRGAAILAESAPLQRIERDSAIAARHAVILPIVNYEVYGKSLLGRGDQITPLI